MKKLIISIVCCAVVLGGYYVYKNKNKLYSDYRNWKNSDNKVVSKEKTNSPQIDDVSNPQIKEAIETLSKTVEELSEYNKKLDEQLKTQSDSITALHVIIDSLGKELASKPKLKIQSSPYLSNNESTVKNNNSNTTKNNKLKNEKNLPIARSNTAVELKRFFTERYDNR